MELQETTLRLSKMIEALIQKSLNPKWKFPGGPNLLMLQKDVQVLSKLWAYDGMADDRVVDYVVYQIYRKRDNISKGYGWQVHHMFTDYAVEKYRHQFMSEEGKSGMNYYINQWLDENDLSRQALVKMIEPPKPNSMRKYVYMESEEVTKRRFLNTDAGYILCQRSTTGWSPQSETCMACKFKEQCEMDTERRLPELVRMRRETN